MLRSTLVLALAAIGCGDDPARVTVKPIPNACGRPGNARNVRITAYAPSQEKTATTAPNEGIDIADFPSDTEQLSIEVEVGGGAVGAAGKTAPFDFLALDNGAELPIFLAPPDGFCPTVEAMTEPRIAPLVARAGEGVLVVGGTDSAGAQLKTAEFFDPRDSTFTPIEVPSAFDSSSGFAGASLATLPDGRVVMTGGAYALLSIFDPARMAFVSSDGIESRAFHASVALDADHVLLAGGCEIAVGGACGGLLRNSTKLYDLEDTFRPVFGPTLRAQQLGATLYDIGVQRDGQRGFVMVGGTFADMQEGTADRLLIGTASDIVQLANVRAHAAVLDGGAVLTAFAPDGDPANGSATVIPPGDDTARAIAKAPDLDGVRLVLLEDGRVLGIGGDTTGEVVLYDPTTDRWQSISPIGEPPPAPLTAPTLVRLADGSVLVLGSPISGEASASAWIYRPSIVGPAIGSLNVLPLDNATGVLTAEDPASVTRVLSPVATWTLTGGATMTRALVGGPRRASGSVSVAVRVSAGGIALVAQQVGPGEAVVGELTEGSPARIVQLADGQEHVLCTGRTTPPLAHENMTNVTASLEISGAAARLLVEGVVLASCDIEAPVRGAWGVAALAASTVTVAGITVTR